MQKIILVATKRTESRSKILNLAHHVDTLFGALYSSSTYSQSALESTFGELETSV